MSPGESTLQPDLLRGFGFTCSDEAFELMQGIGTPLERIESGTITRDGSRAGISPLVAKGVPGMGLSVDGAKYLWYHHSDADTVDSSWTPTR